MALSNTQTRYGSVTKMFHWLTALLILTLIPLGWYANQLPYDTGEELARKAWMFSLHKTLGVAVFFVALARILWALGQPRPELISAGHTLARFTAMTAHWMLYAALVIVPLSGWIGHAAASGFAPIWWPLGQNLPLVPKSTEVEHLFGAIHWVATKVLIAVLLLHIAGALKHHLIDRDATLRRMLPGEPVVGPLPAQPRNHAPLVAASFVWVAAIAVGAGLSQTAPEGNESPATLAEVSSDWQVREGTIGIAVVQFGSEVTGRFADWTADITFDHDAPSGTVGQVTATIAIPSLTLGSVTDQALGADFFDATSHPTAVFEGDIVRDPDGYVAEGTLTIKGVSLPLAMPFSLVMNSDTADMQAELSLDRRAFGIGANMADPATLGFDVIVRVTLKADKATEKRPPESSPDGLI